MENKRIITAAITGSWGTKEQNPAIPMTPEEIADDVYDVWKAGAAVVHIHVRGDDMKPRMDTEKFKKTIKLIREKCDIVINMTSSGDPIADDEGRIGPARAIFPIEELRPEISSYDCGTMNWMHNSIHRNSPWLLENLGKLCMKWNVVPELECFDVGHIYNTFHYQKTGCLPAEHPHYQFIMGAPGGIDATVENLVFIKNLLPENATWGAAGLSKAHIPIMLATLSLGGHLRVGLEDNIYFSHGVLAKSNSQLVRRAADLIELCNFEVATPDDARKILHLNRPYVEEGERK